MKQKTILAVVVGVVVLFGLPSVMAYPILENGHDDPYPPPLPPSGPPPSPPPAELPASGYFTVDSPSGGYFVDYMNVYDPYASIHRLGPSSWMYFSTSNYSTLARGHFPDSSQAWEWPKQNMPYANASIMSVYLLVVARTETYQVLPPYPQICLQFSIDGQANYYPALWSSNATFSVPGSTAYAEYAFNVTTYENWTGAMLTSPSMYVRVRAQSSEVVNSVLVDYVGLRYNWTYGSGPIDPGYSWKNTTLSKYKMAEIIVGSLGVIGFVGMIIAPAVGIVLMRHSDESKPFMVLKIISMFVACFGLFLYSLD